jgi:hypothetical protein
MQVWKNPSAERDIMERPLLEDTVFWNLQPRGWIVPLGKGGGLMHATNKPEYARYVGALPWRLPSHAGRKNHSVQMVDQIGAIRVHSQYNNQMIGQVKNDYWIFCMEVIIENSQSTVG